MKRKEDSEHKQKQPEFKKTKEKKSFNKSAKPKKLLWLHNKKRSEL